MSALPDALDLDLISIEDVAIAFLPAHIVGVGEWHALATRNLVAHFVAAVQSGQGYRVANAVRAMAHVPSREELLAVTQAVCAAIGQDSVARSHDWRRIGERIGTARHIALRTLDEAELGGRAERHDTADATIEAVLTLIGLRNCALVEHLRAVSVLTERIATRMVLDPPTVQRSARASLVHDVGLIAAEDPQADERGVEHVRAGTHYLESIPELAGLAEVVGSHHECYDGSGFPDALAAESIPIEARIIAVSDAFHHAAGTLADPIAGLSGAIDELRAGSGRRFDPVVVSAACQLLMPNRRWKSRSA